MSKTFLGKKLCLGAKVGSKLGVTFWQSFNAVSCLASVRISRIGTWLRFCEITSKANRDFLKQTHIPFRADILTGGSRSEKLQSREMRAPNYILVFRSPPQETIIAEVI